MQVDIGKFLFNLILVDAYTASNENHQKALDSSKDRSKAAPKITRSTCNFFETSIGMRSHLQQFGATSTSTNFTRLARSGTDYVT